MSGPTGSEATRDAIVSSAERAFGQHGYRATTVEDIAEGAGVSRPLVYRYFGDKKRLFRLVVGNVLREWNDELVAVAERPAPTWSHTLRDVLDTCVRWAPKRPMLRGVLLHDGDVAARIAGSTIDEGRNLLPKLLTELLQRGIDEGAVRADLPARDMAFVISEAAIAGSTQALQSHDAEVREARLHAIVETVLYGVSVPAPPAERTTSAARVPANGSGGT